MKFFRAVGVTGIAFIACLIWTKCFNVTCACACLWIFSGSRDYSPPLEIVLPSVIVPSVLLLLCVVCCARKCCCDGCHGDDDAKPTNENAGRAGCCRRCYDNLCTSLASFFRLTRCENRSHEIHVRMYGDPQVPTFVQSRDEHESGRPAGLIESGQVEYLKFIMWI